MPQIRIEAQIHECHLQDAVNRVVAKHLSSTEGAYQSALITTVGLMLMEIISEFGTIMQEEGILCPPKEDTRAH